MGESEKSVTNGGYKLDEVVSALQKEIRRGNEEQSLYWALELAESGYLKLLMTRLQVIASEDIGLADSNAAILINSMIAGMNETNKDWVKDVRPELIGHAVLYLCRAPKNRIADDATYLMSLKKKKGLKLEIPDYAKDCHTTFGKEKLKKISASTGESYEKVINKEFYNEGAKLGNPVDDGGRDWTKELKEHLKKEGLL